jgi:uncharacterized protein YegJ (DUF2314 family)
MRTIFFVLLVLTIQGCQDSRGNVKKPKQINIDDVYYQSIVQRAKDSLGFFVKHIESHNDSAYGYMVYKSFRQAGAVEYLWLWVSGYDGRDFTCILNSKPYFVDRLKQGDTLQVKREEVTDWTIYKHDSVIYGNFIDRHIK